MREAKANPDKHYNLDVSSVYRHHAKFAAEQATADEKWLDKKATEFAREMANLNVPKEAAQALFERELTNTAKSWESAGEARAKRVKAQQESLGISDEQLKEWREQAAADLTDEDKEIMKMLAGTDNPELVEPGILQLLNRDGADAPAGKDSTGNKSRQRFEQISSSCE